MTFSGELDPPIREIIRVEHCGNCARLERSLSTVLDRAHDLEEENKALRTCEGCKHEGQYENEIEYGYPSPCTQCKRRCPDNYEEAKDATE